MVASMSAHTHKPARSSAARQSAEASQPTARGRVRASAGGSSAGGSSAGGSSAEPRSGVAPSESGGVQKKRARHAKAAQKSAAALKNAKSLQAFRARQSPQPHRGGGTGTRSVVSIGEVGRENTATETKADAAEATQDLLPQDELITKVGPERMCVGCGERGAPEDFVRIVLGPKTSDETREIAVDAGTGSFGRGAHLHPRPACVLAAAQRGLQRSFKAALTLDGERLTAASLAACIGAVFDRRIDGLLGAARRSRRMALGADSVVSASRAGDAHVVVVATDAASAAELTEVRRAVSEGRAVAWGTKERLAAATGGSSRSMGLGVVAVTDNRIARAVREAVLVVDAMRLPMVALKGATGSPREVSGSLKGASGSSRGQAAITRSLTDSATVGERRGEATEVNGGTPHPERGLEPSDDGSQAVERKAHE